jgi:hypothetical protein
MSKNEEPIKNMAKLSHHAKLQGVGNIYARRLGDEHQCVSLDGPNLAT